MRHRPLTLVVAAIVAAGAITAPRHATHAQQLPSRDGAVAPVPLRIVRGRVRSDDDSAAALRRARVTAVGRQTPAIYTDHEGLFEVAVPAATPATIRITKPGFAPQSALSAAGSDEILQVRMPRGAAINGRVVDALGGPLGGIEVRVRRIPGREGRDLNATSYLTDTDDLGEFRVGSLPAGDYDVSIEASRGAGPSPPGQAGPGVVVSGTSSDRSRPGAAESAAAVVRVRPGDEAAVALFHRGQTREEQRAASYAAGYEAGTQAAIKADPRRLMAMLRGSAVITGRVTGPDGRGLSGALVRLNPVSGGGFERVAASASTGVFQFSNLPAGSYRVVVTRTGFMPGEHGQERAGQPGRIVALRERQRLNGVDVGLRRGAVVTGMVTDPDGEPLEGIAMHVWRLRHRGGRQVAESVGDVAARRTDDRGRYRLYGLQPGTYYVVAADVPGGAPRPVRGITPAPRSYYPGTPSLAEASTIHVDVGVDAPAVDLAFRPAPTVRVSGLTYDSTGAPLRQPIWLMGSTRSGVVTLPPQLALMSGIRFEFEHVVPGEYVVHAIQPPHPDAFQQAIEKGYDQPSSEFTMQFLDVAAADIENLLVITSRGATITGRVVVEDEPAPRGRGVAAFGIASSDPDYAPPPSEPRPWSVRVNPDWTFLVDGLQGFVRFTPAPLTPPGWFLKSVQIGGMNIADEPMLFGKFDDSRGLVEVVFSTGGADVSGRVVDNGKEVGSYVVVVLPDDRSRWYAGSRYIKIARPGETGGFTVGTLPPGEYWITAVDAFDDSRIEDPQVLDELRLRGRRIVLSPAQRMTTDVTLTRLSR